MSATSPTPRILEDLSKPSYEQLLAMMAKQQAELDALKASRQGRITFRVNDQPVKDKKTGETSPGKRGVSVLGLGQFPLTAYASQWLRILDHADDLRAFIEAHRSRLAWKE